MLKRLHRLGKTTPVLKDAPTLTLTSPYFSVKMRRNDFIVHRFRFVISKKVDKRAVVRNKLKRQMSTVVGVIPIKETGYDYIFYMKKAALTLSTEELKKEVESLLNKSV